MNKKLSKIVSILSIAAVFGIVCAVLVVIAAVHNSDIKKSYVQSDGIYAYEDAAANGRVNLDAVKKLFPSAVAPIGDSYIDLISSPVTLRYYEKIGATTPVHVIDKGDSLLVRRDSMSMMPKKGMGNTVCRLQRVGGVLRSHFQLMAAQFPTGFSL